MVVNMHGKASISNVASLWGQVRFFGGFEGLCWEIVWSLEPIFEIRSSNRPDQVISLVESSTNQSSVLQNVKMFFSFPAIRSNPVPDPSFLIIIVFSAPNRNQVMVLSVVAVSE